MHYIPITTKRLSMKGILIPSAVKRFSIYCILIPIRLSVHCILIPIRLSIQHTLISSAFNAVCMPSLSQENEDGMFGDESWGPSANSHQHVQIILDDDDDDMMTVSPVLPLNGGGSLTRYSPTACSEVGSPQCTSSSE